MRKTMPLFTIGLLSAGLVGCATSGRTYDDSKVAMIKQNTTTEAELLEWFGPPNSRAMNSDGRKALSWKFAPARFGAAGSPGSLGVNLGTDGKVMTYSASGTTK